MDACVRAEKYVGGLMQALENVRERIGSIEVPGINLEYLVDAASRYASDADYYIKKGDCETALSAASYAEGLLDSLKYLGILEPSWPSHTQRDIDRKVFVAGTFDLIHPGHIDLLKYASTYGKLHVIVARDENVMKSKGRPPILPEEARLRVVSAIKYVYKARLGDRKDIFRPIREIKPDIVVLGPDQPFEAEELSRKLTSMLGKEVKVVRYMLKEEFAPGMRGSRDIISKICCQGYCQSIECSEEDPRSQQADS